MYEIRELTTEGLKEITINKNLTINNLIASLQLDPDKELMLSHEDRPLKGGEIIKETLSN